MVLFSFEDSFSSSSTAFSARSLLTRRSGCGDAPERDRWLDHRVWVVSTFAALDADRDGALVAEDLQGATFAAKMAELMGASLPPEPPELARASKTLLEGAGAEGCISREEFERITWRLRSGLPLADKPEVACGSRPRSERQAPSSEGSEAALEAAALRAADSMTFPACVDSQEAAPPPSRACSSPTPEPTGGSSSSAPPGVPAGRGAPEDPAKEAATLDASITDALERYSVMLSEGKDAGDLQKRLFKLVSRKASVSSLNSGATEAS